jgi:hypothetical protein
MNSFINKELTSGYDIFWGEIAPCEHLVQIYTSDDIFLDSLEGFVSGGIQAGDSVIVIATPGHVSALNQRLTARGFNVETARSREQYITLDANETLAKFMVKGWPDEQLFNKFLADLLARTGSKRRVRAFGEMVAILWARGQKMATIRLEELWQQLCKKDGLSLFCAYPKSDFTQDTETSIKEICAAHSKLI